uniref:Uncharacterized protein n=1 Tax=Micrurus corallinus TaxID=54390 RepID=A0A2D4GA01_MICCO
MCVHVCVCIFLPINEYYCQKGSGTFSLPCLAMPSSPPATCLSPFTASFPAPLALSQAILRPFSTTNGPLTLSPCPLAQTPFDPAIWLHRTNSHQPIRWQAEAMLRGAACDGRSQGQVFIKGEDVGNGNAAPQKHPYIGVGDMAGKRRWYMAAGIARGMAGKELPDCLPFITGSEDFEE